MKCLRHFAVGCLTLVAMDACSTHRDLPAARGVATPTRDSDLVAALHHSFDSCSALVSSGASTWSQGSIRSVGAASIFVPDSGRLAISDSSLGAFRVAFNDCPGCHFSVEVGVDSAGTGIDGAAAQLVAEQRAIDSVNAIPDHIYEFSVIDGRPRPINVGGERAYHVDDDCGDCDAQRIMFGKPGYVANVSYGGDDDDALAGRHVCEMEALAKTFRWRRQP